MTNYHIAIVGVPNGYNDQLLADAAKSRNVRSAIFRANRIRAKIEKSSVVYHLPDGLDTEAIDAFLFRGFSRAGVNRTSIYHEMVPFARHLHHSLGKVIVDEVLATGYPVYTKFRMGVVLSAAALPFVDTRLFFAKKQVRRHISELEFPLILKPAAGRKGRDIRLIRTRDELTAFLDLNDNQSFYPNLIQKWIPNEGDYRVVVTGNRAVAAVRRLRARGSIVANMSQNNDAVAINLDDDPSLSELAVKAANAMNIEVAGVDIIEDSGTGERYVLEVNRAPQIYHTTRFSKIDVAGAIIDFVVEKIARQRGAR